MLECNVNVDKSQAIASSLHTSITSAHLYVASGAVADAALADGLALLLHLRKPLSVDERRPRRRDAEQHPEPLHRRDY